MLSKEEILKAAPDTDDENKGARYFSDYQEDTDHLGEFLDPGRKDMSKFYDPRFEEMQDISDRIKHMNKMHWLWDEKRAEEVIHRSLLKDHLKNVTPQYCRWLSLRLKFFPSDITLFFKAYLQNGRRNYNFCLTGESLFDIMVSEMFGYVEAIYISGLERIRDRITVDPDPEGEKAWDVPPELKPVHPDIAFVKPSPDGTRLMPLTKTELGTLFEGLDAYRPIYQKHFDLYKRVNDPYIVGEGEKMDGQRKKEILEEMSKIESEMEEKKKSVLPYINNFAVRQEFVSIKRC